MYTWEQLIATLQRSRTDKTLTPNQVLLICLTLLLVWLLLQTLMELEN